MDEYPGLYLTVTIHNFSNQFHDVLPGSSIELANIDARSIYKDIETKGRECMGYRRIYPYQ